MIFQSPHIDKELVPYVRQLAEDCDTYEVDCSVLNEFKIELGPMPESKVLTLLGLPVFSNVIGLCQEGIRKIIIDEEYFITASEVQREMVVKHELAHCVRNKDHTEDEFSLMNPTIITGRNYINRYQQIHDDLFGCVLNCPLVEWDTERYSK